MLINELHCCVGCTPDVMDSLINFNQSATSCPFFDDCVPMSWYIHCPLKILFLCKHLSHSMKYWLHYILRAKTYRTILTMFRLGYSNLIVNYNKFYSKYHWNHCCDAFYTSEIKNKYILVGFFEYHLICCLAKRCTNRIYPI